MGFESVKKIAEANFPTRWGAFRILGFEGALKAVHPRNVGPENGAHKDEVEGLVALVMGDIHSAPPVVRIHSQCLTGDVFHSLRCDCRAQLEIAIESIAREGRGLLIYEAQEGRGIGLLNKLRAYELQDQGADTVEANEQLGFASDLRSYALPSAILGYFGLREIRLLSNNPEKVDAAEGAGVRVVERVPCQANVLDSREAYLRTKKEKMGHLLEGL